MKGSMVGDEAKQAMRQGDNIVGRSLYLKSNGAFRIKFSRKGSELDLCFEGITPQQVRGNSWRRTYAAE